LCEIRSVLVKKEKVFVKDKEVQNEKGGKLELLLLELKKPIE
jgi:hypothetical protein